MKLIISAYTRLMGVLKDLQEYHPDVFKSPQPSPKCVIVIYCMNFMNANV